MVRLGFCGQGQGEGSKTFARFILTVVRRRLPAWTFVQLFRPKHAYLRRTPNSAGCSIVTPKRYFTPGYNLKGLEQMSTVTVRELNQIQRLKHTIPGFTGPFCVRAQKERNLNE